MVKVLTTVQKGETLSLYASMYGCTVDQIKKANQGQIGENGAIKEGSQLVVPIGKKPDALAKRENAMQEKLHYFDDKLQEAKIKLYDPNLKPDEREKLEQEYINLKNMKRERDNTASIEISPDGMHFTLKMKKDITIADFRKLFPECGKNFTDYADKTKQTRYENGKGFIRDPKFITLHKDAEFTLKTQEYASQGFWGELWNSAQKTAGYIP